MDPTKNYNFPRKRYQNQGHFPKKYHYIVEIVHKKTNPMYFTFESSHTFNLNANVPYNVKANTKTIWHLYQCRTKIVRRNVGINSPHSEKKSASSNIAKFIVSIELFCLYKTSGSTKLNQMMPTFCGASPDIKWGKSIGYFPCNTL